MLTAYANIITDQIINECDLDPPIDPTKFRVLRYHGHAIPEDIICTADGVLSVWWESIRPKNVANGQCSAFPVVILHAKWYTCWKEATTSGKTMTVYYTENDADAARLAWIAECVSRRLMDIACEQANSVSEEDDPLAFGFLTLADKPIFLDCAPGGALGGAASVHWRIQAGIHETVLESSLPSPQAFLRTADDSLGLDFT